MKSMTQTPPPPHVERVNHPKHYNAGKIEVIDVIEDMNLGFSIGNAFKYIARAKHKGRELEDLKKAAWYVIREVNRIALQCGETGLAFAPLNFGKAISSNKPAKKKLK